MIEINPTVIKLLKNIIRNEPELLARLEEEIQQEDEWYYSNQNNHV